MRIINWILSLTFLLTPSFARAAGLQAGTDLGNFGNIAQYMDSFFDWGVPVLGSIAVLMFIYAGYLYMTSQGNSENINAAKEIIVSVILGLLVLFTAQLLLRNVIGTLR